MMVLLSFLLNTVFIAKQKTKKNNPEALQSYPQMWRGPTALGQGPDHIPWSELAGTEWLFMLGRKIRPVSWGENWEVRLASCQLDALSQTHGLVLKEKLIRLARQLIQSRGCARTL